MNSLPSNVDPCDLDDIGPTGYFIYVCCGVKAMGDYAFCPEHGGEPMLKYEAEEML